MPYRNVTGINLAVFWKNHIFTNRSYLLFALCAALFLSFIPEGYAATTSVQSIRTRFGVTMDFLASVPDNGNGDALILFPGGNGTNPYKMADDGIASGWNFLVRSNSIFAGYGLATFIVSPPSDHPTGMSSGFRESPEHAEDIAALARYLEQQGFRRIFLIGNSRGTLSAIAVATQRKIPLLNGIVLTSTLEFESFIQYIPTEQLRLPVLMIHHRDDACRISSYDEAKLTYSALAGVTKVNFVEVVGGAHPRSAPCDNLSSHGFFGMENKVVDAIKEWLAGHLITDRIEE